MLEVAVSDKHLQWFSDSSNTLRFKYSMTCQTNTCKEKLTVIITYLNYS